MVCGRKKRAAVFGGGGFVLLMWHEFDVGLNVGADFVVEISCATTRVHMRHYGLVGLLVLEFVAFFC